MWILLQEYLSPLLMLAGITTSFLVTFFVISQARNAVHKGGRVRRSLDAHKSPVLGAGEHGEEHHFSAGLLFDDASNLHNGSD